ncbi:MAG TPA: hypothetical protein DCE42_22750, partial [Myxococcales bacterium]|nr:hypothetical protein [Myxococcales bacterium]
MKRTQYTLFSLLMTLFMSQLVYAAPQKHVVIISWDGAKPSVIRSLFRKGHMPHLHALMKEGAYTLDATTIVPSITLPSHTSMLTGVSPRKHGITWNRYKPKRGTPKVPTLFKLAKRHKLSTAMIYTKSKFR